MKVDFSKKFVGYPFSKGDFFTKVENFRKISFLVMHHVEGNSADHAISQFINHKVSSHYLIDQNGVIFQLVDENDIAYHAGISSWRNVESLNKDSIGIEFVNNNPLKQNFSKEQMIAGVELSKYLIAKYDIEPRNVVGHSDIAYDKDSGLLNRKQDPSHLFDWKFLSDNGVGIAFDIKKDDRIMFQFGERDEKILKIKEILSKFGYLVRDFSDEFDLEMRFLTLVFNRRFLNKEDDRWHLDSEQALRMLALKFLR